MVSPTDLAVTIPASMVNYCTFKAGFNELIVLAFLTIAFICAIVYMLAQFMRRPEWEAWVKIQLYHAGMSALLAVGAVMFAWFACGVSVWVASDGNPATPDDSFTVANQYLGDLFSKNIKPAIWQLIMVQIKAEYFAATYIQIGSPTFGMGFAPLPVYKVISSNAQLLTNLAMPFASALLAQKIGLEIIKASAFTILLPLGIVLRMFTVTRDAGSFLIATSIGLFVVLPLTYVMDKMIVAGPALPTPPPGTPAPKPTLCAGMSEGYERPSDAEWWNGIYTFGGHPSLINFLNNIPLKPDTMLAPAMQCIAYVIPQAVFLPAMNMIIVIAFINALTKFLSRNLSG